MDSRHEQLRKACEAFHRKHPEVWKLFVRFTFDRIERGFKHYGARTIMERIRWETDEAHVDPSLSFKINDHYPPFYARRFMTMYPEHVGFFRVRHQKSKEAPAVRLPPLGPSDFPYEKFPPTGETP